MWICGRAVAHDDVDDIGKLCEREPSKPNLWAVSGLMGLAVQGTVLRKSVVDHAMGLTGVLSKLAGKLIKVKVATATTRFAVVLRAALNEDSFLQMPNDVFLELPEGSELEAMEIVKNHHTPPSVAAAGKKPSRHHHTRDK